MLLKTQSNRVMIVMDAPICGCINEKINSPAILGRAVKKALSRANIKPPVELMVAD